MKTLQTPSNIEVLLHCHTRPVVHPRASAPAVAEAIDELQSCGAIEERGLVPEGTLYATTPLGAAWVKALCRVERPKQVFVDAQGQPL